MEQFTWRIQRGESGTEESTVRNAKFGDGYEQTSGDGLNDSRQSWPITFSGKLATAIQIRDFLRRHAGKSFLWRNPLGEWGLYQAPTRTFQVVSSTTAVVTSTFEQKFHP